MPCCKVGLQFGLQTHVCLRPQSGAFGCRRLRAVLTADEASPIILKLMQNGIEIATSHNHPIRTLSALASSATWIASLIMRFRIEFS